MNESCVQDAPDDARRKRAFCHKTNHTTDLDLSERKLIFVTSLNRDAYETIQNCHFRPFHRSFFHSIVGGLGTLTNGVSINNDVFYFHPAYREAFEGGEWSIDNIYPNHYFLIDGKIVFVCLRMDACNQQEYYKKVYQQLVPNTGVLEEKNVVRIMVEHKQDQTRFAFDLFKLNIKPLRELIRPVKFVAPEP